MKKFVFWGQAVVLILLQSSISFASGGHGERHGHWGKHHNDHREHYYPSGQYYGPPPRPVYQDPRTHQGLAGGVVGSVLGYELGNGNPVATGIGAAAGSYLGNEISGRR